jgi:ATP-dependent RNA circularization protein (DNA/RNA ligase family)
MKVITSFAILMQLARKLGKAKLNGDIEAIKKAQKEHDDYHELCMKSDKIILSTGFCDPL